MNTIWLNVVTLSLSFSTFVLSLKNFINIASLPTYVSKHLTDKQSLQPGWKFKKNYFSYRTKISITM